MAKTPADKQRAYIAKQKAQDNEKYLQKEWLRKKNRLLSMEKENGKKYEEYLKRERKRKKERQEKKNKVQVLQ